MKTHQATAAKFQNFFRLDHNCTSLPLLKIKEHIPQNTLPTVVKKTEKLSKKDLELEFVQELINKTPAILKNNPDYPIIYTFYQNLNAFILKKPLIDKKYYHCENINFFELSQEKGYIVKHNTCDQALLPKTVSIQNHLKNCLDTMPKGINTLKLDQQVAETLKQLSLLTKKYGISSDHLYEGDKPEKLELYKKKFIEFEKNAYQYNNYLLESSVEHKFINTIIYLWLIPFEPTHLLGRTYKFPVANYVCKTLDVNEEELLSFLFPEQ